LKTGIPENLFKEKEPECFHQARHKKLCNDIRGDIMFCQNCEQTISTTDIVNQSLKRWKDSVIQGTRAQDNRPDTILPLSQASLVLAAYTFLYHMNVGAPLENFVSKKISNYFFCQCNVVGMVCYMNSHQGMISKK
jgi:hypothetical protein